MDRTLARVGAFLTLGLAGIGAAEAGWSTSLNQGENPAYHYAIADGGTSNANIGALALECHVEGPGPVWQLQLYPAEDGPIGPAGVAAEDIDARGATIEINGTRIDVDPLGAGDFLALSDIATDGFAGVSDRLIGAIASGSGELEIRLDMAPDRSGAAYAGFESAASFTLDGAGPAIAAVKAACR
ncbi:MAG: hypothetical protein R3D02_04490 [Hyphomicrobiales bacterium]